MAEQERALTDEERILLQRQQAKRRNKRRDDGEPANLNINSMMDMMVIILVFLIKSVGEEPIPIKESDDLRLPFSNTELTPEDTVTMTITANYVMVLDEGVIPIVDRQIDPSYLQSAESAVIPELQQHLEETMQQRQEWANATGREFEPLVTIISDSDTPYRILTQVMITASNAGINQFKFAVLQRPQGA